MSKPEIPDRRVFICINRLFFNRFRKNSLSNIVIKKTTSGDDYASMLGFDGEEKIEAKIWTFSDEIRQILVSGEVYKVLARTKQYQNRTQLNILSLEKG